MKRSIAKLALAGMGLAGLNALVRSAAAKREDVDLDTEDIPGSYLEINGQRIHYVETGQGDPVVLLHGWNGSTFSMRRTIPDLAHRYRVVAIDLPGYGFSSRSEDADYSTGAQADVVRGVMDRLQIERAGAVLGHSMGGGIAMQLALGNPERVERLVLVSSVTPNETRRARRFGAFVQPFLPLIGLTMLRESVVRRALRGMVHDPAFVTQELVDAYFRPLRVKGHLRAQAKQITDRRHDIPYDPTQIRQPTLILWGEHDRVIPLSTGRELAELIPNAQLAIIRSAGHLALEEEPAECNKLLLEFLSRSADEATVVSSNGASRESASPVL